jgi:hypothetical protein
MTEKIFVSIIVIGITHGIIENNNEAFQDANVKYSINETEILNDIKYFLNRNIYDEISQDSTPARFTHIEAVGDAGDLKNFNTYVLVAKPVIKIIPDNAKDIKDYKIYKKPFIKNDKDYLFKNQINNLQKINLRNTNHVKRYFKKYNKIYFT